MTDELVFYTHPMSRGRIARWMLEELGQPYRTVLMEYGTTMKATDYLAINPMGKVPAIRHGDAVVTETAAICAYLADAFAQAGLAPAPSDRLRAPYYRWMFFAAGPLEAAVSNKMFGWTASDEQRGILSYGSFEQVMDTLEQAVSGREFIVGERFSAADVYVGSHIGWGLKFGSIDRRPAFEQYWERIHSRPAAVRAREIDDALLAAQPAPAS